MIADTRKVLTNLTPIRHEIRSRDDRWYDVRLRPYRTVDDKIDGVVLTFVDMTERKAMETQQRMLLRELTHRVKNTLTVVQSIAHQTRRSSKHYDDFTDRLDGRLAALAAAHTLLVDSEWKGADLVTLVQMQIEPISAEIPTGSGSPASPYSCRPILRPRSAWCSMSSRPMPQNTARFQGAPA
jgi:two-component system CheB/CheR fusion protein